MNHHFYLGIDRSDQTIDFTLLDSNHSIIEQGKSSTQPEELKLWLEKIKTRLLDQQTIATCIEQPCQNLSHFFRQFEFLTLYLVNPSIIKSFRESLSASRAKDDKRDAHTLATFILERHHRLEPWKPLDGDTQRLNTLSEKRRQLVEIRKSITNKLNQALKDTYPQSLNLIGRDLHSKLACDFLLKWPTQLLQKARLTTISNFYYLHNSRYPKTIEKRLQLISEAIPLCVDPVILETNAELIKALARQLQTLTASIQHFDKLVAQATAQHKESPIFASLPGAGPVYTSRLTAFFGSDRNTFAKASEVQRLSGVAPITKQSGKMHFVHRRYACNKFWRQTFVEWAGHTVMKSLWAKAYYEQQKQLGHRHQSILRSLAYKWQHILFRLWKSSITYSEKHYLQALEKSGSPLLKAIETLKKTQPKFCEQFS